MEIPERRRNNKHEADIEASSEEVHSDGEDIKATVTVENSSDDVSQYCQPCRYSGKFELAEGLCSECEEYMCAPCVKYHRNLKATRDHVVLHKDSVDESAVQRLRKTRPSSKNDSEASRPRETADKPSKSPQSQCDEYNSDKPSKSPQLQRGNDHSLSKVVHTGFTCDGCDMDPIVGPRYECWKCYEKDFSKGIDLCQLCKDDNLHPQHNSFLRKIEKPTDFDMKDFIKEIDNADIRRGAKSTSRVQLVHNGIICDGCMMSPIVGERYKCEKCYMEHFFNGVDVCQACKEDNFHSHHNRFLKKICPVTFALNADGSNRQSRGKVVHPGFSCDGCQMRPIVGPRYKCQKCYDKNFYTGVDLCQGCKDNSIHFQHSRFIKRIDKPESSLKTALEAFHQDQKDARMVHLGIICDGCDKNPIVGPRYKCQKCYDKNFFSGVDLCQNCKDDNLHSHHNRFMEKIA